MSLFPATEYLSMMPRAFAFDVRLKAFELEGGAFLEHHIVRAALVTAHDDDERVISRVTSLLPLVPATAPHRRTKADLENIGELPESLRLEGAIPTIVVVHALTGDAAATVPGGYWEQLGRPGGPLSAEHARILSFNLLGSCYGSAGPLDAGFPTRAMDREVSPVATDGMTASQKGEFLLPDASLPATVTTFDQAKSLLMLLDALHIERVQMIVGGSLGGMVALAATVLDPARFATVVPLAATHEASPWLAAWNHIARAAMIADPAFPESERGFEIARQIGMLSYRSEADFDLLQAHDRSSLFSGPAAPQSGSGGWSPRSPSRIARYLEHQGRKLRTRFHPSAHLCLLASMDHHHLERRGEAFDELAKTYVAGVAIDSDVLYTPIQTDRYLAMIEERGGCVLHETLSSIHGHDAFLIEWEGLERIFAKIAEWRSEREADVRGKTK